MMKKTLILIPLLVMLSLACSLVAVGSEPTPSQSEGEAVTEGEAVEGELKPTALQSEKRCGDGVCDGPENATICPDDCPSTEGDTETTSPSSEREEKAPPPWFMPNPTCQMEETWASSEGSPWAYDSEGNTTERLPEGKVTCLLEIHICGDVIFKQQVVNAGDECPESLHFSNAPNMQVCCTAWNEAKRTGSPCDPLEDADCDGVPNDMDTYPLDFSQP